MDIDLILPVFWTIVITTSLILGVRRLVKKSPSNKLWVRKDDKTREDKDKQ